MSKKRILFLDTSKCILIWLVIFGHILEHYMKEGTAIMSIFNFIFSFAMPSFILISGYFTSFDKPLKGINKLVETYVIFQILHAIVDFNFSPIYLGIFPKWTMWYLLSLIWWKLGLHAFRTVSANRFLFLIISILLSVIVPYINFPVHLFSFERTLSYAPFFGIGICIKQTDIMQFKTKKWKFISVCVLLSVLLVTIFNPIEVRWLINWNSLYSDMPIPSVYAPLIRLVALVICCSLAISIISLIPDGSTSFQEEGENSLFYYMWHSVILTIFFKISSPLIQELDLCLSIIIWLLTVLLLYKMRRIMFFNILLNPLSYYNTNK